MNQMVPFANPQKPDEKIEQSLTRTAEFLRGYQPPAMGGGKDVLHDQFEVDLTQPLPQFNTASAKAFAARDMNDGRQLFALVCEPGSLQRHATLNRMLLIRHSNLCTPVAAGTVELSQPAEERYVIFFERLKGQKLSMMLAGNKKIPANVIISRIIEPIVQALAVMQDAGLTHGSINLDNVYYDTHAVLGPCVVEPCGYSQPYYYELVERMQASPAGKGESTPGTDYYALAVLVLHILGGKETLERMPPQQLARSILRQGPFISLTGGREVPEEFFDFLWGMLGSGVNQRWTYRYLKPWLDGKHYNLIPSPPPTEGTKPFDCFGTNGHSRREIAHLIRTHWDKTQEELSQHNLQQWILMSLRQKELAELCGRHIKTVVETNTKNETQRNEHIMRLVLMLDNAGPIQYNKVSFNVDGIAPLVADLYLRKSNEELQSLVKFIELNLISAWIELQQVKELEIPEPLMQFFAKLERVRTLLRNTGPGFGIERLVYDLNPDLPCMSPLCRGRHITSLTELLRHLDRVAPSFAGSQDPFDAHIAAFMASKLAITNEIRLYDLASMPTFANNQALLALKLFAIAQHRSGNIELTGLTHWIAQRAMPAMQSLKSQTVRGRTLQMLLDEAMDGRTQTMGDLLLDGEIVNVDNDGFTKAGTQYARNADRIKRYREGTNLDFDSAHLGNTIAKIFAYMALLFTLYHIFLEYQ